ncbi:hypothetical protein OIU35_16265 [Boseaceae bacterium BT-24-1]|nr:hypothetical protein [Boseaceae bacterium BT-24-1]
MALLLGALFPAFASAQNSAGFRSPSGNIHCRYLEDADGAALRCDILRTDTRPPRRPRDCELDYGNAFVVQAESPPSRRLPSPSEMRAKGPPAMRICHGDTVADPSSPVLAYGANWVQGGFICSVSAELGISCRNARGAGFRLSRNRQELY